MPRMEVLGYKRQTLSRLLSYSFGNSVCDVLRQPATTVLWSLLQHIQTARTDRAHMSAWWWAVRPSVRGSDAVRIRYSLLQVIQNFREREPTTG